MVEIYGPESSGKTTLTLHVIAEAQKAGGVCAFIDAEHALDPGYARKLGVDLDDLLISQPDTGEQALEIADTLVRSGAIDVIVVDSVAALVPKAELEGEMGDSHVGLQARLMSQALRKLTASISRSKTMVIFTNQIRSKIGVMFGSPETTTGGNALKFYASVRLDIRRIGQVKERDETVGNQTRVKVVKNKVAPPFRIVEFDIMYGEGISKIGELIDLGVKAGLVEKSGSWFSYGSQRIGQGRENAKAFLRDQPGHGGRDRGGDPLGGRCRRQWRGCRHRSARRGSQRRRRLAATSGRSSLAAFERRPIVRAALCAVASQQVAATAGRRHRFAAAWSKAMTRPTRPGERPGNANRQRHSRDLSRLLRQARAYHRAVQPARAAQRPDHCCSPMPAWCSSRTSSPGSSIATTPVP